MPTIALVGGAHIHTPGFAKKIGEAQDITCKYVWDPDADTAQRRQQVTGGQVVDEPQAIFDDGEVQAVVICSQTDRHEALVTAAAEAGKHMFVEKPLGMGAADSKRMADVVEKAGVIFQTGYFMRSSAVNRTVRAIIRDGSLGKITRIRLSNCHNGSLGGWFDEEWRWMANPKIAGVGAFGDLGTHVLDLLLWFLEDDEPIACTGAIQVVTGRYDDCDESGEGMVRFTSGVVGTIAASWVDVADPNKLEVCGTQGHVWVNRDGLIVQSPNIDGVDGEKPIEPPEQSLPHAFDLFLNAVRGEQDVPLVTVREAALRSIVMEAIYAGARQKTWVKPGI